MFRSNSLISNVWRLNKLLQEPLVRSYATKAVPGGRQVRMKPGDFYFDSAGSVADSWIRPKVLPPLVFLPKNFKIWINAAQSWWASRRAIHHIASKLQKPEHLPTWMPRRAMAPILQKVYENINKCLVSGDISSLRDLATSPGYKLLTEGHMPPPKKAGQSRIWSATISQVKPLTWRVVTVPNSSLEFAQIAAEIRSIQQIQIVEGEQVVKTSEKVPVQEIWVFEKDLKKHPSAWKFTGRAERAK